MHGVDVSFSVSGIKVPKLGSLCAQHLVEGPSKQYRNYGFGGKMSSAGVVEGLGSLDVIDRPLRRLSGLQGGEFCYRCGINAILFSTLSILGPLHARRP
jgi:hypothetical protein